MGVQYVPLTAVIADKGREKERYFKKRCLDLLPVVEEEALSSRTITLCPYLEQLIGILQEVDLLRVEGPGDAGIISRIGMRHLQQMNLLPAIPVLWGVCFIASLLVRATELKAHLSCKEGTLVM